MNRTQLSKLYDSFPENRRDMPKAEFIKRALNTTDRTANENILNQMVQDKQRTRRAQIQKTVIDSAVVRGKK